MVTMKRLSCLLGILALFSLSSPAWAINLNSDVNTLQNAVGAPANGTNLTVDGYSTVTVELTVSATATVTFEGSTHTVFSSIPCINKGTRTSSTTATVTGLYQCDVAGLSTFRARVSAWTSGTVTAVARASQATNGAGGMLAYDAAGNALFALGTLLSCEDQSNFLCRVSGGAVRQGTVISGVTTNTTSAATTIPTGAKSLYGQVVCSSGACVQSQAIYGDTDNDAANGEWLGTITLSGTTRDQAVLPLTGSYSFYYVITTLTSGTSATGAVYAMY